jgi:hypothetical protein
MNKKLSQLKKIIQETLDKKHKNIKDFFDEMFENLIEKDCTIHVELYEAISDFAEQTETLDSILIDLGGIESKSLFGDVIPIVTTNLHDTIKMEQFEKILKLPMNTLDQIIEEHNL